MTDAKQNETTTSDKRWYSSSMIVDLPIFFIPGTVEPIRAVREVYVGAAEASDIETAIGTILRDSAEAIRDTEISLRPVLRVHEGLHETPPAHLRPEMKILLA